MSNIYLPVENINDFACYVVYDKDTIRAYYSTPTYNSTSNYIDFFINSHYLEKEGSQSWGSSQYTKLPNCITESAITNDVYYRNDLAEILVIFSLLVLIMFWVPLKLTYMRLFRRFN